MNINKSLYLTTPPITAGIIVTGPDNQSGKSTFVETASECVRISIETAHFYNVAEHAENIDPGFIFPLERLGRITINNAFALFLIEWPGGRLIPQSPLFDHTDALMIGGVILLDSAKPETFRATQRIIQTFHGPRYYNHDYVIAAGNQDSPDAWSLEDLRVALQLEDIQRLVPCAASDRESVKQVLLALLDRMPIGEFITQAMAKIRGM